MKTYVFDASALFAYVQKTPGGPKVSDLIKDAAGESTRILISAVNYGEVYGVILRLAGKAQAYRVVNLIRALPIEMADVTPLRALHAAEVKTTYKLDYADSFAAALALEHKATLVTSDSDFRKLGHGANVLWLKY